MKSLLCFLACLAYVSASGLLLGAIPDDGQWRPWLDGSILGVSPGLATAALGAASVGHGLIGAGHIIGKRSLGAIGLGHAGVLGLGHAGVINPNALNVPLDTVHVAAAKNAQLISQATEGARNIAGAGVPLALPADTPEVAIGKAAHAIAHDTERAAVAARGAILGAHGLGVAGIGAAGLIGGAAVAPVAAVGGWGAGVGLGGWGAHGLGVGLAGRHGIW